MTIYLARGTQFRSTSTTRIETRYGGSKNC